ncbi:hypothetical protein ONA91_14725 [Micromonospora sp. DR5-3]|uniref:hypothetical protein n=1 Tax=unclassified Micromonospora TaxID=2617518 RepID=UPI0011D669F9|nr:MULTISPECIES: hypothetical protein [unclassified Micromonospora]MCW3815708.1 hypothetical protein [Micromonospora sp. DR5-3]TYC23862.1 hypothetical protein FXF52_13745 [Micromonospora sp. MP36]
MPTLADAARIAGNPRPAPRRTTHRRTVMRLAGPGIRAAREVYTTIPADAVRVAALVEISAAAAALARTVVKLRHLDPDLIAPHVGDRVDLRAVLGRGRWLPTMTRHVPAPQTGPVDLAALVPARPVRRRVVRRPGAPGQGSLFAAGTREVS